MTSFSGFKGKGFRFDETEAQLADERKKLQKAALGLHDSDEEETALDVSEPHECVTDRQTDRSTSRLSADVSVVS